LAPRAAGLESARMLLIALVALHVAFDLVWIGSILSVAILLAAAAKDDDAGLARAALVVYRRLAVPSFAIAFLLGAARMSVDVMSYLHLHWFHGKLTLAIVVIALHHVIGARAKKAAAGSMQAGRSGAILAVGLFSSVLLVTLLAVLKAALVP
jgi:putative membrane protein